MYDVRVCVLNDEEHHFASRFILDTYSFAKAMIMRSFEIVWCERIKIHIDELLVSFTGHTVANTRYSRYSVWSLALRTEREQEKRAFLFGGFKMACQMLFIQYMYS